MARFIVVVLDGFGIGAMPDVAEVRPQDTGANTARKLLDHYPDRRLPTLEKLGLQNVVLSRKSCMHVNQRATTGQALLAHQGGDTFMGHQEIMGTHPRPPLVQPFQLALPQIEQALRDSGYRVQRLSYAGLSLLMVEQGIIIGDNLEADLGQVYNLTCNFRLVPFDTLMAVAEVVRSANPVARNIAFGGDIAPHETGSVAGACVAQPDGMHSILSAVEVKPDESGRPAYIGVNAPRSGAYDKGFRVAHLGYGVDHRVQVPAQLQTRGICTTLVGKVADIVANPHGISHKKLVDTDEIIARSLDEVQHQKHGFFCINIQETDLSGHQQDPQRYWRVLERADVGLSKLIALLSHDDLLIVTADHGNDPFIGHGRHTREAVPLLVYGHQVKAQDIGQRATLADIGASACQFFAAPSPEYGESFLTGLKEPYNTISEAEA